MKLFNKESKKNKETRSLPTIISIRSTSPPKSA